MSKLFSCLSIFVLLLVVTACQKPDYSSHISPLIEKYVGVWNGDSLNVLDKVVSENFQLRMIPSFEPLTGLDALKKSITQTRSFFPDFQIKETEKLFVGDTAVVLRWIATGTFKGENDMSPSGSKVDVPGFSVIFFNDGKLTGEWIAYSDLTWNKQLGFELVPHGAEKK
jgi:predicted ester cyclase